MTLSNNELENLYQYFVKQIESLGALRSNELKEPELSKFTRLVLDTDDIPSKEIKSKVTAHLCKYFQNNERSLDYIAIELNGDCIDTFLEIKPSATVWGSAIQGYKERYDKIPESLKTDKQFVQGLVSSNCSNFGLLSHDLKNNREICLSFLEACQYVNQTADEMNEGDFELPSHLLADKQFVREAVARYPTVTYFIPEEMRADVEFMYELFAIAPDSAKALYFDVEEEWSEELDQERVREELLAKSEAQRMKREVLNSKSATTKFKI